MKDFPQFMKNEKNHIKSNQQNTKDIDGYFFEGEDGSQMTFGHIILIESPKSINTNLTSTWFVLTDNIL